MAKREGEVPAGTTEDKLGDFAADLGNLLGTAQNKASAWLDQRKAITEQLTQIRDTAQQYLTQLSGESPFPWKPQGRRRGRPAGTGGKRGPGRPAGTSKGAAKKGRRKMSAAARKRISEAQKARWAKQKDAKS